MRNQDIRARVVVNDDGKVKSIIVNDVDMTPVFTALSIHFDAAAKGVMTGTVTFFNFTVRSEDRIDFPTNARLEAEGRQAMRTYIAPDTRSEGGQDDR